MEVLYRKYRPKKFKEIVGQDAVKRVLMRALENGEVSHAYIFAGPRGTGKTTTARILAKALNCEKREGAEPCGKCYACKAIDDGTFMDVMELDAASNRGIDEIRRIREGASFRPIEGKYKVYIIDEVHMLTREAFNALLKTLEEPPDHVVFILATTNLEKVPSTIVSRCQVLEFKNLPDDLIFKRLKEVCEKEGIDASDEALRFIAKRSQGGMRDALTMLEQVWRFSGGRIEVETVEEALGLIRSEIVDEYINAILRGDVEGVRKVVRDVFYSGKDLEVLLSEALERLLERISEGEQSLLWLSKELLAIMKDAKLFENKKLFVEAASVSMIKKLPQVEEKVGVLESGKADEKGKEEEKGADFLEKVLNYLRDEGDLSLFVSLSIADEKSLEGDVLRVVFSKGKELHYEFLKRKILELESAIKKAAGLDIKVEVDIKEKTKRVEEVEKRMMSLFESEGERS